jgi:predicted amidophosphoribosyltransferase
MGMRAAVTALVDLVLPADCAGCGALEHPWCAACRAWLGPPSVVELPGGLTVHVAGRYAGPLRAALLRYKERGRRDLAGPLGGLLAVPVRELLAAEPVQTWLVPAPSRAAAARVRGGDHVLRLCRTLSVQHCDVRTAQALRLGRRARDSVGLDAAQRAANLAGRISAVDDLLPPPGARVVLIDDVVTTGSMLRTCRSALADRGIFVRSAVALCDATGTKR